MICTGVSQMLKCEVGRSMGNNIRHIGSPSREHDVTESPKFGSDAQKIVYRTSNSLNRFSSPKPQAANCKMRPYNGEASHLVSMECSVATKVPRLQLRNPCLSRMHRVDSACCLHRRISCSSEVLDEVGLAWNPFATNIQATAANPRVLLVLY